ncbi:hypothetical protein WR25_05872 isoform B [Diploscapter pachys]|uniref:MENTAL domain-containing protein n=1 Tax=Diploscapter pachys TaxID=2018661 RepID=A0A2A2L8S2_9BILA|nr:hypothetical protein WR25_05872 isoform A [Diploscapter pachys]PAV82657.1 hypothetical protein WR25_05872 isoform B [Diploscapter pachys]
MSDIEEPLIQQRPTVLSKERRRSIVLSVFDAVFTILLWLISTVTKGDDWRKSFLQEIDITNPNFFKISLFDIVIMGLIRATILITCYAIFPFKHWLPVAVTTGLTSAFIIIKVLFFFSRTQSQLPQYILVLASFAMCWFELYVMPFKYSQRERQYADYSRQDDEESRNVRTPSVQSARRVFRVRERLQGRHAEETTDIEEYRSAIDFSSDDENPHHRKIPKLPEETKLQIVEKLSGAEIYVEQLLREAKLGEWKIISGNGDPIVLAGPENYYCIRTEFKRDPMLLFNAAWKDMLKWNTQLLVGQVRLKSMVPKIRIWKTVLPDNSKNRLYD